MSQSPMSAICLCLATVFCAGAQQPGVILTRDGDRLTKFSVDSGKGRLEVRRNLWSNTTAFTESGQSLGLIDPLMYSAHAVLPDGSKGGGYWNKPEVFDLWQVEEVKDPERPEAGIVKIVAEPPGFGLRKEVTVTVERGENVAYVYNRLTAVADVALEVDRQTIYLSKPEQNYVIRVDGRELTPKHGASTAIQRHLVFQHKKSGASAAVVFLDRAVQEVPGADRAPFGSVRFYDDEKANGADCCWQKGGGSMMEGDARVQQYALVWGDGDLREKVEALSAKALAGELNHKVHVLPKAATPEDLVLPSAALRIDETETGPWLPLRTQPTKSTATYQHSTYLSPYNALTARKIIAGFGAKKPMLLVRGPFGRVVIGREDGLIHGMRPRVLAESFQGSYLREYAEGWNPGGALDVSSDGPLRVELRWTGGGATRRISVWASGLIETEWTNGPKALQLFTGCHPYHYVSTDGKAAVRFSQLIQRRRALAGASSFALFGYRNAALEVKARGLSSEAEEVWLDSGEVGWEWVMDVAKKNPDAKGSVHVPFANWIRRHAALTYLAGGAVRKLDFAARNADYAIDYRISEAGARAMGSLAQKVFDRPAPETPAEPPPVTVRVKQDSLRTTRVWPNDFHGWELRPLKLVHTNPMPATYEIELAGAEPCRVAFDLAKPAWLASAMVESEPTEFRIPNSQATPVDRYVQQSFGQESPPVVEVEAGKPKTVLLRLQPVEETLGDYEVTLRWRSGDSSGSHRLKLRVVPSSLVDPYGNPLAGAEDQRLFGHTIGTMHPNYLVWHYPGGSREEEDAYLRLWGEHALRRGSWLRDHGFLRNYITAYTQDGVGASGRQKEYFALSPDEFVKQMRRDTVMRAARFPYRYRVYLADEIWEILGGYKGRRYMPIPEVARWTRDLIMDCPNPCWYSFQQPGIDDEYQTKLPNDIPELFYYCGRDEAVRSYVHKLVEPRRKLIDQWKQDPACRERAGTDDIRPMFSFWISGQLHVTDYPTMRRQHWYARFNGIDIIMFWVFRYNGMIYADRIGCNSLLSAGEKQVLMTDRSLAWHDLREDMTRITLVRVLKEKADPGIRGRVEALENQASAASQENDFDRARDCLAQAVRLMAPHYADLVGPQVYAAVESTALPNLHARDEELSDKPKRKRVAVRKLKGGHRPAPTLNAELDNSYLEEGAQLDGFHLLNTHGKPGEQTAVHLAWDSQKLYVLYICNESQMGKLVADPTLERDKAVYSTDCVELFLDPAGQGRTWLQFIVGAGGTVYDARSVAKRIRGKEVFAEEVAEWNPDYGHRTARGATLWAAELHLPWDVLGGAPKPGAVWRMNFARERKTKPELSVWSPQEGAFRDPAQFGEVQFVE